MKKSNKLLLAWSIFITFVITFIVITKIYYDIHKEQGLVYQYRILISKDLQRLEINNNNENQDSSAQVKENKSSEKPLDDKFYELSKHGYLPKISPDGVRVLDAYSAKFDNGSAKKIYLAVSVDSTTTENITTITKKLQNSKVTFIIPYYIDNLPEIANAIINSGNEFFIKIPTQRSLSEDKKGIIHPFLANMGKEDLIDKLENLLASTKYAIGIANVTPTLFTKSISDMSVIYEELSKRGLAFLDLEKSNEVVKKLPKNQEITYAGSQDAAIKKSTIEIPEIINDESIFSIHINDLPDFLTEFPKKHGEYALAPVSYILKRQ